MKELFVSDWMFFSMSLLISVCDFIMYKILKYIFNRKLYNEEFAKGRYTDFLKSLIAIKSTIPVPIFMGVSYAISRLVFHIDREWIMSRSWIICIALAICWLFWCSLLWICRKIYKKIRGNRLQQVASPFYDKK